MALSQQIQNSIVGSYSDRNFSMMQIAEHLKISPSTVFYYLEKHGIKRRSRSEASVYAHRTRFGKKPFQLLEKFSADDELLRMAGVMLYWAEGVKGWNSVKFTNSDPDMIRLFLMFLRRICGAAEDRIHALLHVYPDHDINELEKFWSNATKIPRSRFYKAYIHIGKVGTYKNKSKYGTIAINYSDTRLLSIINMWIKELSKNYIVPG